MARRADPRAKAAILAALASGGVLAGLGAMLDHNEGNKLTAYRDAGGVWTICRGITHDVRPGETRTTEQCVDANSAAARKFLQAVDAGFIKRQPDTVRLAFTDFAYNVGIAAFQHSTARKLINRDKRAAGCLELDRWIYVKGRVIEWQVKRRALEREICLTDAAP